MNTNISKQSELIEKVINAGLCVKCGACVGICPYFHFFDGKVVAVDKCISETGRCLQLCPQSGYLSSSFEKIEKNNEIGHYEKIIIAKTTDKEIEKNAQYGGVVTSLIIYALNKGIVQSALLTDSGKNNSPAGKIADKRAKVIDCAGSRYTASAGLSALNTAINNGAESIAVTGLPCQMEAIANMEQIKEGKTEISEKIKLKIGLFCTWALDYRRLNTYLADIGLSGHVKKFDIPPPPAAQFKALINDKWNILPIDDIRPFIQKGCFICRDMTAVRSDISVGMVEGVEGWNTVIIRNKIGAQLIKQAIDDKIIKIDNLDKDKLDHLKEASFNKSERGKTAKESRGKKI